jgi:hypothetical protein
MLLQCNLNSSRACINQIMDVQIVYHTHYSSQHCLLLSGFICSGSSNCDVAISLYCLLEFL